ncbi:ABC transporter permease [Thiohalorhabdus sp. Cl-TMA]|uniref:ABC transporter permease n=1 Tax=Thiohalorhabdus methylotrophus TaxID=3242694 RepID=A0ABV4TTY6_9GAMM
MTPTLALARKEFRDGVRNRWVLAVSVALAVLALALAYFGAAPSGRVGFTPMGVTIASLTSLAIYLIPLIALVLCYGAIVGEREQGTLLLLLGYPVQRWQIFVGKFLGQAAILTLSILLGFSVAGGLLAMLSPEAGGPEAWEAFGLFVATSILLALAFQSLAYVVSAAAAEKTRAAGMALLLWFAFALFFDLVLLGLLVATEGAVGGGVFPYLLLLNPADVYRLINLAGFDAVARSSGLVSVVPEALFSRTLLLAALAAWVVAPLALAAWLFNRGEAA